MNEYSNVSCDFYDELLQIIKQNKLVSIDYEDSKRNFHKIEIKLKTIITKDKAEFLVLENDIEIRLDYLHKVGEVINPDVFSKGQSCSG